MRSSEIILLERTSELVVCPLAVVSDIVLQDAVLWLDVIKNLIFIWQGFSFLWICNRSHNSNQK